MNQTSSPFRLLANVSLYCPASGIQHALYLTYLKAKVKQSKLALPH